MRYCKRTFFNTIMQPHRIGKPIFAGAVSSWRNTVHTRREFYSHKWKQPMQMIWFKQNKTRKNAIVSRYSKVRHFKLYHAKGLRTSQSIFVRRAKRYESVKILDI